MTIQAAVQSAPPLVHGLQSMMRGIKLAQVTFAPTVAQAALKQLVGGAAATREAMPDQLALDHDSLVQVAALFAVRRNEVTVGYRTMFLLYDVKGPTFVGTDYGEASDVDARYRGTDILAMPIVGASELVDPTPGGGPIDHWGPTLALAYDRCSELLAKAPGTSMPPSGSVPFVTMPTALPVLGLGAIAIIVAGVAVMAIGAVAVYRYLDPQARLQIASVEAAGAAYRARLDVAKTTGQLPPPSPIEEANAEAVKTSAREASKPDWLAAGGIVGGVAVGAVLASAIGARR